MAEKSDGKAQKQSTEASVNRVSFNSNTSENAYFTSFIDRFSDFIDSHLLEARLFTVSLLGVGLIVIGRSIRIGTKFSKVQNIPKHFIRRHVCLRGLVKSVDNISSTIYTRHIPIVEFSWFPNEANGLLPVSLYGIVITPSGVQWMKSNCADREVWFQLMSTNELDRIDCIVTLKKRWLRSVCINEFLVKHGLAKVHHNIDDGSSLDSTCIRFLNAICEAETEAHIKKRGIWKEQQQSQTKPQIYRTFDTVSYFGRRLITASKSFLLRLFKHKNY